MSDNQIARNVLQSAEAINSRDIANWLLPRLTDDELATLSTSSAPPADQVNSIAAAVLRRAADQIDPPA
ncbi:hypothetical protein [Aeoliella sp.]|uniref:hypothetical protein n=1 Tax=Aeoliella sp. TaxID=2795800 RepID=UPI003CCC12C3